MPVLHPDKIEAKAESGDAKLLSYEQLIAALREKISFAESLNLIEKIENFFKTLVEDMKSLCNEVEEKMQAAHSYLGKDCASWVRYSTSSQEVEFSKRYYMDVIRAAYELLSIFDKDMREINSSTRKAIEEKATELEFLINHYRDEKGVPQPLPMQYQCQIFKGIVCGILGAISVILGSCLAYSTYGLSELQSLHANPISGFGLAAVGATLLYKSYGCFFPPQRDLPDRLSQIKLAVTVLCENSM